MITAMNTVNQTFNWSRFTAALRKEIVESKRGLMFTLIGIYGVLTLIMILGNLICIRPAILAEILAEKVPQTTVAMIFSLVVMVSASMAFKGLKTKASRTSLLTSPSSTLEKFLVNVLIYVVGIFVAFFACAQLSDLTRIAVLWWFRSEDFMVPGPMNFLTSLTTAGHMYDSMLPNSAQYLKISMWVGVLASAGLYLLGSVIWPRLSLLKTFAAVYAIEFCLFIIVIPVFIFFSDSMVFLNWMADFFTQGTFGICLLVWAALLVLVTFGLAWYLFKRKDVISLKWWK